MKKLLFALFFTFSMFSITAQNSTEEGNNSTLQVMVPRDVFIGDSGQIQYSFRSPVDFFAFNENSQSSETMEINLQASDFLEDPSSCLVSKTTLSRSGVNYNLCITIIPWKTGMIKFRKFNLEKICSREKENTSQDYDVELAPVIILSLAEKLGATTLRPPESPLLLPHTNYYLWFFIIFAVILFSLLCVAAIRLPDIIKKWKQLKVKFGFYKNALRTKRLINNLMRKKIDDSEFALEWQKIIRSYLEYRFRASFASVTGKNIAAKIERITGGMLDESRETAVEELTALFVRTDYIRFAAGSIDSRLQPASFLEDEKKSSISATHKIIDAFEKEETDD